MSPDDGPVREIDKSRWPRLSPLLDELLDMEPAARVARLAAMRDLEPELAADLELLLARDAELAGNAFLAAAAPPPTLTAVVPLPGQLVGAYRLEREIGQGGMGTVWLARRTDGRFEGQVAVKFLASGLLGHGDAGRFAREGQILARLTHPNIARLIDAGVAQDGLQPYLVLEFVEDGQPIDRFCETQRLDTTQRVSLFLDVLAAVAHAHNRLILHRDLKPGNILVDRQGQVKLLDFGIAKLLGDHTQPAEATELTRRAGRAFTPQFAAPEQVQGGDVTTATDVYALGVLLYLLLSGGKHPTAGATRADAQALERMRAVVEEEPKRLSELLRAERQPKLARELRGDLDTIVAKALKKAPGERYENAAALAEDLKRWLNHEPIAARPDSRTYRLAKFLRRHYLGVAAGGIATLSLATGIGLALWKAQEAQQQRIQAEGLIEFMLGDLRKKLEPVGRLDVLDAVGEKALGYYSAQDLARSDADSLGRRARALHLMGEIAEKRGKMGEAEQLFRQAADSTGELLARDPTNTQRIFDHAQSSYWVGYAAWRQRKLPQAEDSFTQYLRLADSLVQKEPSKPEWLTEQAYARQNLGVLKLRSGSTQASLTHFQAAEKNWQSVIPMRPQLRAELATTLGWLAEAQERQGHFEASITSQQAKLSTLIQLGGLVSTDRKQQQAQVAIDAALSRLYLAAGHIEEALASALRARESYSSLAASDPENIEKLERLSFARLQLAETWLLHGKVNLARQELTLLNRELDRLRTAHERKPDLQAKLQGRWLVASLAAATAEEYFASRAALNEFLSSNSVIAVKDVPDTDTQWVLAMAALTLGDALPANTPEAATHWDAALTRLAALGDTSEPRVICLQAHTLIRLYRTQEARVLAEKLEASAYRHPLYADLIHRLAVQQEVR
ncbi:protein kinase [Roseateles sp. DAIF2]|uniref:serine/threonine protein kinase n=1 Tax=Roseateles sp. DAIF2 TaxID=2714952 RepID=UPI0018A291C1|nr:serine/threonine-protein kinase [Roseateles sp. DAIF2]QPF71903.1 protein kinase [Roseateles sp. DAIF2]